MNKRFISIAASAVQMLGAFIFAACLGAAWAGDITPKMQPKIEAYKKQVAAWAADVLIVKAAKESNAKGPIPMMGNAKWRELMETDPIVKGFIENPAGQLVTKWLNADAKGINKIVLSGDKSHRVAFTSMPAAQQGESKPDPSTNIDSVQISAPVKDGDKVIGVLLVALTVSNFK